MAGRAKNVNSQEFLIQRQIGSYYRLLCLEGAETMRRLLCKYFGPFQFEASLQLSCVSILFYGVNYVEVRSPLFLQRCRKI